MTARLDALKRILPPPPAEIVSPPWSDSMVRVGFAFPEDYREFVGAYGGGVISTPRVSPDLAIAIPHAERRTGFEHAGFEGFIERHLRDYGDFLAAEEDSGLHDFQVNSYPPLGGLLAWGETSNSDMFFWLTSNASPDKWPVVVFERHPGIFVTHGGGMVEFLVDLLEGRNHASAMMRGGPPAWRMNSDWVREGLDITAGPASGVV